MTDLTDPLVLNGQTQSPQQRAFYSELRSGTTSLVLEAVAGSGKTTTIVNGAQHFVPPSALTIFLAFNKRIVEELRPRVPSTVNVGTFHSVCLSALSRSLPSRPRISADKTRDLLKANLKWKDFEAYGQFATRLVSYAKSAGVGIPALEPNDLGSFQRLVAHFSLTLDSLDADPARGIAIAMSTFDNSVLDVSTIDFDDMLYLALLRRVRFDVSNFIFVDEAQDTNSVQRELLKLMGRFYSCKCSVCGAPPNPLDQKKCSDAFCGANTTTDLGGSRLIAVGDPMQAIYGFRGADSDALDLIKRDFNAKTLDLSVCYRCSQSVISEVHKHFPQLKP